MGIYKGYVYTVHKKGLTVFCHTRNGSFFSKYEHIGGVSTVIEGMCLMMNGNTPMLVVSAHNTRSLVWIQINDVTMDHHHTQQLDYQPYQSYNDTDRLMVCDYNNMIHRYSCDGQSLEVISLPGDVRPRAVTRYGNQYVISDRLYSSIKMDKWRDVTRVKYMVLT